ncbi:hypothetical protein AGMMS50262_24080 [Bacteroidia bacterium]|nr:hypothetical protein AGMMS50262_24080 [Bacteroidia bacterium]
MHPLFKAPRSLKNRLLVAFTYSAGLRLNEVRHVKISDIDTHRMQIRIRQGKGKKDRYVILSRFIKERLQKYLDEYKPQLYLFEGQTTGDIMGERSIHWIINDTLLKTSIKKKVSMHLARHMNFPSQLKTSKLQEYFS